MKNNIFNIHSEGLVFVIIFSLLTIIFFPFIQILGILFALITFFIIYFFRDPQRIVPIENVIISPADGIITNICESKPPKEINIDKNFLKISIFLSIFNVHVNRVPTTGKIIDINYLPGQFISATSDKSSDKNEKNIIVIENNNSDLIIVSQIAGLIARRIVCDLKNNEKVIQGDKFGIIKFGSRVDLYLPLNYSLLVAMGQTVIGGETIIANPNKISKISKAIKK